MSGDDHGHGHGDQSPFIQHHYDDAQHQFDSGKFGIWLFLAQEVLFFSALFVAYVLYRVHHPEIYSYAHKWLDVKYGAINTGVLIFSSLTAAWAVRAAQLNQKKLLIACLTTTILCACTFLGIKYVEYMHKIHEHILFGRYFDPCISPGGEELLTKRNECMGTKGTVTWDFKANDFGGKAAEGCLDADKIDTDTNAAGIQAKCDVFEQEKYHAPILKAPASHDCTKSREVFVSIDASGGQYTFTGECDTVLVKGGKNTVAIEKAKHVIVDGEGNTVTVQAADDVKIRSKPLPAGTKPDPKNPPPFEPISTVTVAAPLTGKEVPKAAGIEGETNADLGEHWRDKTQIKEQCADELLLILNANHGESSESSRQAEHEAAPKFPCWRPAYQPAVCPDLTTPEQHAHGGAAHTQFGILVEYNDKVERENDSVKIRAACTDAPEKKPVDPLAVANASHPEVVGQKAIHPVHVPTVHEEHEIESLGPPPEHTNMFFTIYFAMTGLHGIHVLVGILVFLWLLIRSVKGHFTPDYFGPVDFAALYWHIVDLIWIFLFPLLYLIH